MACIPHGSRRPAGVGMFKYKILNNVIVTLTYLDVIDHLYGTSEFSVPDFATRVSNPRAAKLLSDLKRRGQLARTGRGHYRRLGPAERPDLRRFEWERVRKLLLDGPTPMAWAGASAVEAWTGGSYRVSPSAFVRVFTLAVPRTSLGRWRRYLKSVGLSADTKKRIGTRIELLPVNDLKVTFLEGEPVISRTAVLELIRAHPALFANAARLVDDRRGRTRGRGR